MSRPPLFWSSAANSWIATINNIIAGGPRVSPRGLETREIMFCSTNIRMDEPIVTMTDRKLNYEFMAAEALSIITGDNTHKTLSRHIKTYDKYARGGTHIQWAYGPKIVDQIWYCAETLIKDSMSRQAVINIWRENPRWDDPPCTLSLQFLVRENFIHCIATMRSSDIWLGWPYDVFSFSMVTAYLSLLMGEKGHLHQLGLLQLNAGSMHIYQQHVGPASDLSRHQGFYRPVNINDWWSPDALINDLGCLSGAIGHPKSKAFQDIRDLIHTTNDTNANSNIGSSEVHTSELK